jgi:hypothetical protein
MGAKVHHIGALELAELIGVTYKQIDRWSVLGYIREEPRELGTGHKRTFRNGEVRIARIMGVLVSAGVAVPIAAKAARSAILEVDNKGPLFMSELKPGLAVTGRIEA